MKSKLCISPIISTILILVVTILSVTSFLSWYSSYESNLNTKIESTVKQGNSIIIETIAGSVLYVKSNENTTIKSIKLDNNICSLDLNLTIGINEIDISTCLNNLTRSNPSVSLVSDNQVLSKNIYIKTAIINSTSTQVSHSYNNCSFSGINISHNQNMTFYLHEFQGLGCTSETRICHDGILSGSYNYTNCTTELAVGGDETYDIEVNESTYRVHVFKTTGVSEFTVKKNNLFAEYLIVAGGGGGGSGGGPGGGGGGAGEVKISNYEFDNTTFLIYVGTGGVADGIKYTDILTGNGKNSSIEGVYSAIGGGGGATYNYLVLRYEQGESASSGGGGGGYGSNNHNLAGSGISGKGNIGGNGWYAVSGVAEGAGGGGGGVSTSGGTATSSNGGNGGLGVSSSITGTLTWYGGGGGGGTGSSDGYADAIPGIGIHGGGNGGRRGYFSGTSGSPNTGSGGGGGGCGATPAGDGGSGIVVIRYLIN